MPKAAKPKAAYLVTLKLNDDIYVGEADTAEDAIRQIKPPFYKTKGVLRIEKDGKSAERILNIIQMKRLFSGIEVAILVTAKNLLQNLK